MVVDRRGARKGVQRREYQTVNVLVAGEGEKKTTGIR